MLEYPTKIDEDEQEDPPREQTEEKQRYTCQNCRKIYSAIRGKLNHLDANQECRKVPQKETFVNECQECGRIFHNPYGLRERQKYICIQQESEETKEADEEPTNKESTRQQKMETQYMPLQDKEK